MEINLEDPKSCASCAASILFGDEMVTLPDDEAVYCSCSCAEQEGAKEKHQIKNRLEETECEYCAVPLYVGDIITYWNEDPYCSDAHASVDHAAKTRVLSVSKIP